MDTGKTQVAYKKGEVYLCTLYGDSSIFKEVEILDVAQTAKSIKTDVYGWIDAARFHGTVKGKIGHAEYRWWSIFKQRRLVRNL
jgi:hypothetical protein